ncbi:uncharacterized protein LOC103317657 [Nasonia vitripennis]|uniref:Envelope protein n=1 Tax=Nasonia vitripennis TaxID=7425 RepID=A0A7M7HAZ1_NASVI|nr:uncharacterized protein LOC103317657 [Nasonia vitripennis]
MFCLIFALAFLLHIRGDENSPYELIPITTPILREELFQAKLYHEIWTTIHFVDILELESHANEVNTTLQDLRNQCSTFKPCIYGIELDHMYKSLYSIQQKIDFLVSLSDKKSEKRGLFNIVGTIQHFLFGTMSADDAERIDKQIDDVYNHMGHIATLLNDQTAIIKSTLRKFINITENYKQNMKIIKDGIITVLNEHSFNDNMLKCILNLNIHIDNLLGNVNLIYDSIVDGKLGVVSPRLISPTKFMDALRTIHSKWFHQDLLFPLNKNYYVMYMKISKINIILSAGKLIYVFHTPIPTGYHYTVYKFTPIPMSGWKRYYIFDSIKNQPVAVDSNFTEYSVIDLNVCTSINDFKICEITSAVHTFNEEESCYAHLIKYKDDNGCSRKYFDLQADFVLALSNGFSWYILPTNKENIFITCGDSKSDLYVTITKPHILRLNSNCKGYSKNHKYLPRSHGNETKISEYKINIQFLPVEQIALNTSALKLPVFTSSNVDTSEILNSAKNIEDIMKDLEIITSNHNYHSRLLTGYSIFHYTMYTIATISVFYILYKTGILNCISIAFKFCLFRLCPICMKCKNNNDERNEAAIPFQTTNVQIREENIAAQPSTSADDRSIVRYDARAPIS